MRTVYVPVVGSVWVERLKLDAEEDVLVSVVPSGFKSDAVTLPIVLPVMCTVACCPDVPLNVRLPF